MDLAAVNRKMKLSHLIIPPQSVFNEVNTMFCFTRESYVLSSLLLVSCGTVSLCLYLFLPMTCNSSRRKYQDTLLAELANSFNLVVFVEQWFCRFFVILLFMPLYCFLFGRKKNNELIILGLKYQWKTKKENCFDLSTGKEQEEANFFCVTPHLTAEKVRGVLQVEYHWRVSAKE